MEDQIREVITPSHQAKNTRRGSNSHLHKSENKIPVTQTKTMNYAVPVLISIHNSRHDGMRVGTGANEQEKDQE